MTDTPTPREAAIDAVMQAYPEHKRAEYRNVGERAVRDIEAAGIVLVAPAPGPDDGPEVSLGAPGVLWMAMRYALGRRTYAVGEACDAIVENLDKLTHWQAARMAGEIEQHLTWAAEVEREQGAVFGSRDLDEQWRACASALRTRAESTR